MRRISSVTRIAVGLTCLTVTMLLAAQSLGLLPDAQRAALNGRRSLCEAVTVECCLAAQRDDAATMRTVARALVARDPAVRSVAVRRTNGLTVVTTSHHVAYWKQALKANLPGTHVTVPIYRNRSPWGNVEFCFEPLSGSRLWGGLSGPQLQLILFVTAASFLVFLPYLHKILRHLDPSQVVPARVRATLDTLAEGVLILDVDQRIVLANKAFAEKVGGSPEALQGVKASQMRWFLPHSRVTPPTYPWSRAIGEGVSQRGVMLNIAATESDSRTLAVNAMPILGGRGEKKGVLATFDDITTVEHQNLELERMLKVVNESRAQIQRQNQELYVLATRDPLTQCLNRRSFFEKLEVLWKSACQQQQVLSFVMVDVDHFKLVNDRHGHSTGDEVLREVSATLRRMARQNDVVGRYGGEEFCVALPGLDPAAAALEAERYRQAVADLQFDGFQVTASFGVAGMHNAAENFYAMIERADRCLYAAKHRGRNRVVRWDQLSADEQSPKQPAAADEPRGEELPISSQAVNSLVHALAYRDMLTAEHSRRVAECCVAAARGLLSTRQTCLLEAAGLLHDIGKLAIPDTVLLKPGPLTADEQRIMDAHDRIGAEILAALGVPELCDIVRLHHAWYGGNPRLPDQPSGNDIPQAARLLAIGDAYAAMRADRVYRPSRSRAEAFGELRKCAGSQFDPELVERFIEMLGSCPEELPKSDVVLSKHTALMIGLQIDRLTLSLDAHDYDRMSLMAGRLAAIAATQGASEIAKLASNLERSTDGNSDLEEIVTLVNDLLAECRSAQSSCLDAEESLGRPQGQL
jgi:diguanylate cyclase (GGDEF)-like protein/putative nucleotidyltransferase with HDIG domain/PAS domain S-box-containing protein